MRFTTPRPRPLTIFIVLAALVLVGMPAGSAEPAASPGGLRIAATNNQWGTSEGDEVVHMGASKISISTLKDIDVLAIGASDLAGLSQGSRKAVDRFLDSGRPVIVIGAGAESGHGLLGAVAGGDSLFTGDGVFATAADAALATGAWRLPDGATAVRVWAFDDAATRDGKILQNSADWRRIGGSDGASLSTSSGSTMAASSDGPQTMSGSSSSGTWSLRHVASYCYDRNPYGRICYQGEFHKLLNDQSSWHDWWDVLFTTTTEPGKLRWGNNWHTSRTWLTSPVDYFKPHILIDAGPGSQSGGTASYCVGPTAGVDGAVITANICSSYALTDVTVSEESSYLYEDVYIRHDIAVNSYTAGIAYSSYPGFTVRTDEAVCVKLGYTNKAEWREYVAGNDNYYQTWMSSWREVC